MIRVAIIALIFASAFIGLLVWMAGGTRDRRQMEEQLLENQAQGLKKGPPPQVTIPPPDRPRKASDVILRITYPPSDDRAREGGPVILSLRGNSVCFRRDLGSPVFERHRLELRQVNRLLEQAAALSSQPAPGLLLVQLWLDKEHPRADRYATETQANALLSDAVGNPDATWVPPSLDLTLEQTSAPAQGDTVPWPSRPGLAAPATFTGKGASIEGTKDLVRDVVSLLSAHRSFTSSEASFRLVRYEIHLP